ncbi:MAG TPA: hypothetical protein VMZ28_04125 [Kofleriaceae bacterium]|nr:hypothetical protein [Kofleriaceae bacterium]
MRLVLAVLTLASGCTPVPTYTVRRAALAPHAAPPLRNGQGMQDRVLEGSVGASTLMSADAPKEGQDANAGLYIPRVEMNAAMRVRARQNLDIGLLWDHGFRQGAYATSEDIPEPKNGSVYGGGPSIFYSMPTAAPGLRVGLGFDFMIYSIPYVEYRTCATNCGGNTTSTVTHDRDQIGVYSLSVVPSWRSGRFTIFGGGTVRNHPTVEKGTVEVADGDDEVSGGPAVLIAHAGMEVDVGGGVRAMGMVYQPLEEDPVRYMPTFGVALTVPLARDAPATTAAAPPSSLAAR